MSDHLTGGRVHVYEYGEAHDDLRAAFYVDERAYADPELARTVLEIADAALRRLGVIYSVEVTSGDDAHIPFGVPTWEEFRQRHFVEGVPLPVRPRPRKVVVPPSWEAMSRWVDSEYERFRAEVFSLLDAAFPGGSVSVRADYGPMRRSPGSIDLSEERYGFEIALWADTLGSEPVDAVQRVAAVLREHGWQADIRNDSTVEAFRDEFRILLVVNPGHLLVEAESPLYRAPAEPGSSFVIEPRPRRDVGS